MEHGEAQQAFGLDIPQAQVYNHEELDFESGIMGKCVPADDFLATSSIIVWNCNENSRR